MFLHSSSVHRQEFFTVHTAMVYTYVIQVHVEFYSKNKFEKLVHLVCFIIRIYHDARSPERQIRQIVCFELPFLISVPGSDTAT